MNSCYRQLKMLLVLCGIIRLSILSHASDLLNSTEGETGQTFVIVHGAWAGGWAFKESANILTSAGHTVYRPTLTGLGEKVHLADGDVGLSTHISDVVNLILWEDLSSITLVGHSYGGMVISGVMEQVPERIHRVVYLDAIVPEDGESVLSIMGDAASGLKATDGFVKPVWIKSDAELPHDVPHPVKTWSEPIRIGNPTARNLPVLYILTVDKGRAPDKDDFHLFYQRAKERGWVTYIMQADHNPQLTQPVELARLLSAASK